MDSWNAVRGVDIANITAQLSSARFSRYDERQASRYGLHYVVEICFPRIQLPKSGYAI